MPGSAPPPAVSIKALLLALALLNTIGAAWPADPTDGRLHLSVAEQRLRGLKLAIAQPGTQGPAKTLSARVVADPAASMGIAAPLAGHLSAPEGGFPRPGQRVDGRETLAWLVPTLTPAERGALGSDLARAERDLAVADLQLKQFSLGYGGIVMSEDTGPTLLPRLQAEQQGAQRRLEETERGLIPRIAVIAPRAGVLGDGVGVEGRGVAAGERLFELIDPARLWLETLGSDASLPAAAVAVDSTGRRLRLELAGRSPALSGASVTARYRVLEGADALLPGAVLGLRLMADVDGCAALELPPSALGALDGDSAQVWIAQDSQTFVRRRLHLAPGAGGNFIVRRGLLAGERVVAAGLPPPAAE